MPAVDVSAYLAALPDDRRAVVETVRRVVNDNLPRGYEEGIQYGMIGWYVPKSRYPAGYHVSPKEPLPFAHLAAQKSHYALYLMFVHGDPALVRWFTAEYAKSGKKLDMGKACVRFKRLDDLPVDVVGRTIAKVPVEQWVATYEAARDGARGTRATKSKPPAKKSEKAAPKKAAPKKAAAKKTAPAKNAPKTTGAKKKTKA
jgi:uncharacterized protein YdhG (YjbR/CyaY superfamily)